MFFLKKINSSRIENQIKLLLRISVMADLKSENLHNTL